MKQNNKISEWLKYRLPSMIITLSIAVLVYISQFPYLAGIISFVIVDGIMGYLYKNKTSIKKATLALNKNFNVNYFDLYHEYKYNQWMFILKSVCLALTLCPIIHDYFIIHDESTNILEYEISYIGVALGLAVIFFVASIVFSVKEKSSEALSKLCNSKKENWFSDYTDDEKKIIQDLFDSPLTQQVK